MAGAGYKLFNTGDVLTAAQVNTYLQEQVVMVFANATARTTALSGVLAEGMVSYLKDTDALEIYSGSAWVGYGSGDITGVTAGTGISGGGTSGTVTITNSMATEITASGDIIVGTGSGTFDNLPIGTTGQVLTADTTVSPYKVKWAAASAGALTKITSGSFSNVATVDIDSVFSSTYDVYLATVSVRAATSSDAVQMQFRYGSTTTTSGYYASQFQYNRTNTLSTNGSDGLSQVVLSSEAGNGFDTAFNGNIYFTRVGISSNAPTFWGSGVNYQTSQAVVNFGGVAYDATARTFSGFRLKSSSSNITGSYIVYGLAK